MINGIYFSSGFNVMADWGVYIGLRGGALSLHCPFFCPDTCLFDRCYSYSTDNGHNECTFKWVDVDGSDNYKRIEEQGKSSVEDKGREERSRLRLQDRELQEMSDGGWCLSMHQPWASLLVRGIKR